MADTLGPFEIGDFIARGGMGEVWRCRHRGDGHEAALKIVSPGREITRAHVDVFRREVHAAASLNHPSVVAVWDYGEVKASEARASEHGFEEGTPWLAMELATLGTLETAPSIGSWRGLKRILMEILDGLAHAHARGLIHRDLKPGNVLITEQDDEVRLLLADFGIVHALDPVDARSDGREIEAPSAGTPYYMPPEQIRGQWREWGPWTDLYAVGSIGWELATGSTPFTGSTALEIALRQIRDELPEFTPEFRVPEGFETWLRRLLQKDWWHRYTCAADAAWGLLSLDASGIEETSDVFERDALRRAGSAALKAVYAVDHGAAPAHCHPVAPPTLHVPHDQLHDVLARDTRADVEPNSNAQLPALPPVPRHWRRDRRSDGVTRRAGLGLFDLREVPLVDREECRDLLWESLRDVARERRPRVVILQGASGTGKTCLLRWFTTRAHEVGAATILRSHHGSIAGPGDGLPRMLTRHLNCSGLDRVEIYERLQRWFQTAVPLGEDAAAGQAAALTQLVSPADPAHPDRIPPVQFGSPAERYATVRRYLGHLARPRPVVMTADDAQFGFDVLGFVEHLLADPTPMPVLVVLGVRDTDLEERPLEARRLAELAERVEVTSVELGRLGDDEHRLLVDHLVGIEDSLADQVVEAADGDPLFTTNVMADWVQRGALVPGPQGFHFDEGADFELPTDVLDVCEARIVRAAARFAVPSRVVRALEVAAALGDSIDDDEWAAVCAALDLRVPSRLAAALAGSGLISLDEVGWTFKSDVVRRALVRSAERGGRWLDIQAACGHTITRAAQNGSCVFERRARHLLKAEHVDEALAQMSLAIQQRISTSAYHEAIALIELYLDVAQQRGRDMLSDDVVAIRGRHADACRFLDRLDDAIAIARQIGSIALVTGSAFARAEGLRVAASLEHLRDDRPAGIRKYTDAMHWFEQAGDTLGVARCAHGRGWLNLNLSLVEDALHDFQRSARLTADTDAKRDHAWALHGIAEASLRNGDLDRGEQAAREAHTLFSTLGSRSGVGMSLTTTGSLRCARGERDECVAYYRAAINQLSAVDSPLVAFPLLLCIRAGVKRGDAEMVQLSLDAARPIVSQMSTVFRIAQHIGQIYLAAVEGRVEGVESGLDDFEATVAESGPRSLHPDLIESVALLADVLESICPTIGARFRAIADRTTDSLFHEQKIATEPRSTPETAGA